MNQSKLQHQTYRDPVQEPRDRQEWARMVKAAVSLGIMLETEGWLSLSQHIKAQAEALLNTAKNSTRTTDRLSALDELRGMERVLGYAAEYRAQISAEMEAKEGTTLEVFEQMVRSGNND